jgi:hypothetical protein
VLAVVVLVFVLILRKGAPPPVKVYSNAAARAEEKIRFRKPNHRSDSRTNYSSITSS